MTNLCLPVVSLFRPELSALLIEIHCIVNKNITSKLPLQNVRSVYYHEWMETFRLYIIMDMYHTYSLLLELLKILYFSQLPSPVLTKYTSF